MEAEKTPDNVVILNHDPIVDPLRQGLLLLCRQLGRPLGDAELVDGMPLEHGRLPLHMVARALRRADITAQVTRQPLRRIDRYLLPALLLLDDGRALVLVGNDGEHAEVLVPQSDGGSQRMPLAELEALYSGTAVFASAATARTGGSATTPAPCPNTGSSARSSGSGVPTPRSPPRRWWPTSWRSPRHCSPCRSTTAWCPTRRSTPCGSSPAAWPWRSSSTVSCGSCAATCSTCSASASTCNSRPCCSPAC